MYRLSGETDAVHYKNEEDVRRISAVRPSKQRTPPFWMYMLSGETDAVHLNLKEDDASVSVTKRMVATATVERLYKQQLWFTGD